MNQDFQQLTERIKQESAFVDKINNELDNVIVGQKTMIERLLIALLSNGHILLEGVPGLAKTLAVKSLAAAIQADFSRLQFTPDLLPADLTGTMIFNMQKQEFTVRKGPIFANFILADEINRAPAKVQAALLEAMQERQVTIGDTTYKLPDPFLVLATMNPIEQEGTYPLPEAQVDRFMLKCVITYPSKEEEQHIIRQQLNPLKKIPKPVLSKEEIMRARAVVHEVYLDEKIEKYIVDLVFATRYPAEYRLQKLAPMITFGGSPRASIALAQAAKSYAFLQHRAFVIPDDVRAIAHDVLRHRVGLSYEAEAENITPSMVIDEVISVVQVP